ncbi:hypothetical protein GCM10009845_22520 [Pedococcus bigeumensis]
MGRTSSTGWREARWDLGVAVAVLMTGTFREAPRGGVQKEGAAGWVLRESAAGAAGWVLRESAAGAAGATGAAGAAVGRAAGSRQQKPGTVSQASPASEPFSRWTVASISP